MGYIFFENILSLGRYSLKGINNLPSKNAHFQIIFFLILGLLYIKSLKFLCLWHLTRGILCNVDVGTRNIQFSCIETEIRGLIAFQKRHFSMETLPLLWRKHSHEMKYICFVVGHKMVGLQWKNETLLSSFKAIKASVWIKILLTGLKKHPVEVARLVRLARLAMLARLVRLVRLG